MSISLVEVAGANFRTDYDSDKLNTDFMGRLGMRKRYLRPLSYLAFPGHERSNSAFSG